MHFVPIWIFFAVILTGLVHGYGDELLGLFLWINISMTVGILISLLYTKIYRDEFRNVYQYLNKYLKD